MKVLVTGGAGFIGSHTCLELLNADYEVIVLDSLVNSKRESLTRVQELAGKPLSFYQADLLDAARTNQVFVENKIDAVIHFAALKAPGESVKFPLQYYHNNLTGTIHLLQAMQQHSVRNIVFSSSATVYGQNNLPPLKEDMPLGAVINPYGWSKQMMEQILKDLQYAEPSWNIALLRYFNPVGAHPSGRIGEDPNGIPTNLLPYISQVAVGKYPYLRVFGNDYPTPDGTCVRDYIHVMDLAGGHVKALEKLQSNPGLVVYNLGAGRGNSVLEVVAAFSKACGHEIPYQITGQRTGDLPVSYADPTKAENELNWKALKSLDEMCEDVWRWQSQNPNGYE